VILFHQLHGWTGTHLTVLDVAKATALQFLAMWSSVCDLLIDLHLCDDLNILYTPF
jgi:hypothetical protein